MSTRIKTQSGDVIELSPSQLYQALEGALINTGLVIDSNVVSTILGMVVSSIHATSRDRVLTSNEIESLIDEAIHQHTNGHYLAYQEVSQPHEEVSSPSINVVNRQGERVPFNVQAFVQTVKRYMNGYEHRVSEQEIVSEVIASLFDGVTTAEINQACIMAARGRIERDPAYSTVAARFLLGEIYKQTLGTDEFDDQFIRTYRDRFSTAIHQGIAAGRLDPRMREFNFVALAKALDPSRDTLFQYLGLQTIHERYLLRTLDNQLLETPQYFWMRVAMGLALDEPHREERALEFYQVMSTLSYVPSTPTLFHSGTTHPQMSSCYLTTVEDELSHIFKSLGDNAQLSKWSGGLGNDWSNIRATNAKINSINVGSQGVIPFLKIVDSATAAINRSGKRRGATCVYLETWHYDIEDFLELRKNTGDERRRTHEINTANWIPDLFMKRVLENGEWTLFSPDETPDLHHLYGKEFERAYIDYEKKAENGEIHLFKKVSATGLWRKMITMLFETGHPWITFKDPCNVRSPQDHVGVVHSSNLCTEITLNTSAQETAVCNLGSINISRHIREGRLDNEQLASTVKTAIRMLDNVIDLNFYPTDEARYSNLKHRPIGLGIMGLQDALYQLNMNVESEDAIRFSDQLMEFISYYAILSSSMLAQEKGTYESYAGSKWDRGLFPIDTVDLLESERGFPTHIDKTSRMDWAPVRESVQRYGMRNSNCLAIAPTATIANIAGCLPSIEPIFKNLYVKSNQSGEFTVVNQYLINELQTLGLWGPDMLEKLKHFDGSVQHIHEIPEQVRLRYKEVFEIDSMWLLRHAAQRGKWIDQSQSLNIFTSSESGKLLSEIYIAAWKIGLKTTYYLRTLGASAIEKSTIDINKNYEQATTFIESESYTVEITELSTEEKIDSFVTTVSIEDQPMELIPSTVSVPLVAPNAWQAASSSSSSAPKMCLIDDPTCEACQ